MKRSTTGALLLLVLGGIGVLAWYFAQPYLEGWKQRRTSDAKGVEATIRIGGDNYLGYWFVTSPEMRKQAARRGLSIQFTDDGGAYAERLAKFAAGEYEAIVLPVNSYLQHGSAVGFPGVIVGSISESRGADGIVGYGDRLPGGRIEDLNDPGLKIVYTPESPSEFLLDLTIADFDLDRLQSADGWRVHADGSRDVFEKARTNQGDVFVLWEPDVSRALALPGMTYIWGSDRFAGYIVDVFVFRREFVDRERTALLEFFRTYFRVLRAYGNSRDRMLDEMEQSADLDEAVIRGMLDKIEWYDLEENRRLQFGIRRSADDRVTDGLINTIISCTDIMLRSGRIEHDPLDGNPYLITNSGVIEELVDTANVADIAAGAVAAVTFEALSPEGWARLREVGTFRVEPIMFQSWNNELTEDGQEAVDRMAQLLKHHYPGYRVLIRGHTAAGGDEGENIRLSRERAEAVLRYLKAVHGIDPDRLRAEGFGSKQPPRKKPGESPRAYRYRLSRVESVALEANPL